MILENTLVPLYLGLTVSIVVSGFHAIRVRRIRASEESAAAAQAVKDRRDMLRNLAFADLTNPARIRSVLETAANGSDFCKKATEVTKISASPVPHGIMQFTRAPDGTVKIDSTAANLGSLLIEIHISAALQATFGRGRWAQTRMVVANQKAFVPIFPSFRKQGVSSKLIPSRVPT